jgi:hypothetical protein
MSTTPSSRARQLATRPLQAQAEATPAVNVHHQRVRLRELEDMHEECRSNTKRAMKELAKLIRGELRAGRRLEKAKKEISASASMEPIHRLQTVDIGAGDETRLQPEEQKALQEGLQSTHAGAMDRNESTLNAADTRTPALNVAPIELPVCRMKEVHSIVVWLFVVFACVSCFLAR